MDEVMKVGPQVVGDGQKGPLRGDREGALVVTDAHGRYTEASRRGKLFVAANVAAQAVSVALTTTYTGLCLSNPAGSGKTLSILACRYALSVAPVAIASLHLIAGYSGAGVVTHTTPLAAPGIQNCKIGAGVNAVAKADSAATIVNPFYLMPLNHGFTAGSLPTDGYSLVDLGGIFSVPPGGWIAFGALTAVSGFGGFVWEELDEV